MLDDMNVLSQRDPAGALAVAAGQWEQAAFAAMVKNNEHDGRTITRVVVTGMGGSALAALLAKAWLGRELTVSFEVVRNYDVPGYIDEQTLVIASSYSGNTEETLSGLEQARAKGAQIAIITSGGTLREIAESEQAAWVELPADFQPRMAVIYNLRALTAILATFGIVSSDKPDQILAASDWLHAQTSAWQAEQPTTDNYAKQLALLAVGKTPVIYGGALTAPVAYKWKISWNENAKNVAFWNEYPEFNHNEFMGWASHPIEKPFVVFDLVSSFEHAQILKRFEISDRLLSGKRPKATVVNLAGDTLLQQLLWASILADFVSIYVAILNGVDPTSVELIETLKKELS